MASEVLITITKEEREQAWLRSREKYVLDTQSNLVEAKRKAEQKGIRKGRVEGKLEVARKMKEMGDSDEKIYALTRISPDML